ncbi:nucleotidyltransferase family protein [archaeon]|jgi:mannose-1-phosphate guanylyltransferase|nr:nucleotidyltransferase family protein [archaeon]MBT3451314.1 nucleotidyltransferase family protein [archaeon]MBT6869370.1 nucleotidyltransferase family protein [archaeon]MBT7192533.1 nucleotidyltransferase family protein [archaeon]MBT7380609.1 nucleotidyltransferase family protein [archaeon]
MIDTAIILAGGLGTRLRPLTEEIPKPLLPIKGKPMIEHSILHMKKHGVKNFVLSIGYKADKIQQYFGDGSKFGVNISYSIEEKPLGTGGAVKQAVTCLDKPFILAWGDNLMDINYAKLFDTHKLNGTKITMALTPREDVEHFGVAKLEKNKIAFFVEKPKRRDAPSNLINAGAFVIEPEVLDYLPQGKSSIERDLFERMACFGQISAYKHEGQWFPTDTLEKYQHAEENFKI